MGINPSPALPATNELANLLVVFADADVGAMRDVVLVVHNF